METRLSALAVLAVTVVLLGGTPERTMSCRIHGHGSLDLMLPVGVREDIEQPKDGGPPTIFIAPYQGAAFGAQLLVSWREPSITEFGSFDHLRRVLEAGGPPYYFGIGEGRPPSSQIVQLSGGPNFGVAYPLVNHAPEALNPQLLRQGVVRVGDLLVRYKFFVFRDSLDQMAVFEGMLMNAVQRPPDDVSQ